MSGSRQCPQFTPLATELLTENAILLLQIGDHVLLLTVDESGEGDE